MDAIETSVGAQLVEALLSIPAEVTQYGAWWGTAAGRWLHSSINDRIGVPVIHGVHRLYGASYEPSDVANTAVTILANPAVRASVLKANDPWAYLYTTLKREMNNQAGPYFRTTMDVTEDPTLERDSTTAPAVPITDAIRLTTNCLTELAPNHLSASIAEAVYYFAEHGHSQLSHLYTRSSRDPELISLGLTRRNILAIANAVLGSRPNHGEASLLAGFLSSDEWTPEQSAAHSRALAKFRARINQEHIVPTAPILEMAS